MAIPSGSGTEVLCRGSFENQSNSASAHIWASPYRATVGTNSATVPANTIITMLSIIACEAGGAAEILSGILNDGAGDVELFWANIPVNGTFVFNDKFVLMPGDKLSFDTTNTANIDILTTFIKQDWT